MTSTLKRSAVCVAASAALVAGAAGTASAQPVQDGLINVAIGDVTILEDVNVAVAAQVAAQICGLKVGPVAVLGRAVDRSGETTTVCEAPFGDVVFEQA